MDEKNRELPNIVSPKNIDFIYNNMTELKAHIVQLEIQYATLHLLNFFDKFPEVESFTATYEDTSDNGYLQNYEINFLDSSLEDDSFKFLEVEHNAQAFLSSMLEDLPRKYQTLEAFINRDNIQTIFRQLMGENKFDLWQASIEKEQLEEGLSEKKSNTKLKL